MRERERERERMSLRTLIISAPYLPSILIGENVFLFL